MCALCLSDWYMWALISSLTMYLECLYPASQHANTRSFNLSILQTRRQIPPGPWEENKSTDSPRVTEEWTCSSWRSIPSTLSRSGDIEDNKPTGPTRTSINRRSDCSARSRDKEQHKCMEKYKLGAPSIWAEPITRRRTRSKRSTSKPDKHWETVDSWVWEKKLKSGSRRLNVFTLLAEGGFWQSD